MSEPAILIEDLGKQYQLGLQEQGYTNLRETIARAASAPWRRLRSLGGAIAENESFWALRHVSFEVQHGEVIGIIGSNGAGKSTLLKIVSQITEPTEGRVVLNGRVASLLEVGTGFHAELTGRENIFLNGAILGMSRAEIRRKFDEIVAFAETEQFLDTPIKRYSSGMLIRLAFSVAAHLEPEILVIDEILAVGDVAFQKKCLGKMEDVATGGRTVLFVSHNMTAIRALCSSCALIDKGRLVLRGSTDACVTLNLGQNAVGDAQGVAKFSRPGRKPLWLTSAALLVDDQPVQSFEMGRPISIQVSFAADPPLSRAGIGIVLINARGERLIATNNYYTQQSTFESPASAATVVCDLGVVPLMAGRYSVELAVGDWSHVEQTIGDALVFEVLESAVDETGKVPDPYWGSMWWPAQYTALPAEPALV